MKRINSDHIPFYLTFVIWSFFCEKTIIKCRDKDDDNDTWPFFCCVYMKTLTCSCFGFFFTSIFYILFFVSLYFLYLWLYNKMCACVHLQLNWMYSFTFDFFSITSMEKIIDDLAWIKRLLFLMMITTTVVTSYHHYNYNHHQWNSA